jgi:hypothetical protein
LSDTIQNDQEVLKEGRKNTLENVDVPLRERIINKLVDKLEDIKAGSKAVEMWNAGNARRADYLKRQQDLLLEFDEFVDPIHHASQAWSSTLHLPVAFIQAKTYHARFLAALIGIDPPFTVKSRTAANEDRAMLIQDLMRYTLSSWVNREKGIDEVIDTWLWSWVTSGCGILKMRWNTEYSRFWDVVKETVPGDPQYMVDQQTGQEVVVRPPKQVEVEKEVLKKCHDGPLIEFVPTEDVLIVGGDGDPDKADAVIQQTYMTASELWTLVDRKVFREEAVEKIIEGGESAISSEAVNAIKIDRADSTGTGTPDKEFDLQRYQILEVYAKMDVDGSGINSDVIYWVAKEFPDQILRATYLYRVSPSGLRPYSKIDFHKRQGQDYGVGLIELLYSITSEIDAVTNMKMDFGLLSSLPFGFYRPTASLTEERLPFEPGSLIPLDNPQADVYFPQMGNRTGFLAQEEQFLMGLVERVTSISDLSLGMMGSQGAARTATGARALLGESNANLDVFLRRMNRGWKRVLIYMFNLLKQKIESNFMFRVLGDDGNAYWRKIESPEEIQLMVDFELDANSANSNKTVQIEQANSIVQSLMNPLLIQLGVVTPLNIFEAYKNKLIVEGTKDFGRYLTKPQGFTRIFAPAEIGQRVLSGIDVKLGPEQDLQGFLDWFDNIMNGQFMLEDGSKMDNLASFEMHEIQALAQKAKEAQAMLNALNAQQAQFANQNQMSINSGMAQAPTQMPQGAIQGNPAPGAPEVA